ncbi:Fc.00g019740.m01.CDS01 [Cosmosporella sp. VM-42]
METASPLKPRALRRFYEPIVITKALTDINQERGSSRQPESTDTPTTDNETLKCFLNKISNVCDRQKGGKTVTSSTVLQHDQGIIYVLGCNQVSYSMLKETSEFVDTLLQKIDNASDEEQGAKRKEHDGILRLILAFNRPRVENYIRGLQGDIETCLKTSRLQTGNEASVLNNELEKLNRAISDMNLKSVEESEYLSSCFNCLHAIQIFFSPQIGVPDLINERARQGRMPGMTSMECWSDLRHHISRLQSYGHATREFIKAKKEWPELFRDFKVIPLPSSRADANPLGKKSENAHNIIGRMVSDDQEIAKYRELAEDLQMFDLDGRIKDQCKRSTFRPYVHSEVLVLDWVAANSHRLNFHFFRGFKYIGSSKPTCKLCDYYFKAHPSRIEARPTHGNLYTNWRFPDVLKVDGEAAIRRRQNLYNSMRLSICDDGFRILEDKSSVWKKHDSNTYSVMSARQTDAQTDVSIDDLGERLRTGLNLRSTSRYGDLDESVSDDEGGGASLI